MDVNRRQYLGVLSLLGAASTAGCGSDSTAQVNSPTSPPGGWDGPIAIAANDDAQSIIERAGVGSWFVVEPGSEHHITPPFDIPEQTVIDAGPPITHGSGRTIFRKAGDGDMATIGESTVIRGVHFTGKRESYTGNGLVDRNWNQSDIVLLGVRIDDMAGDARVRNTTSRWISRNTEYIHNGGFAIRNISTDHDGPRRGQMINGQIRRNDKGGIYTAPGAHERDNDYHVRIQNNYGPAYVHDTGGPDFPSTNVSFRGSIANNAGPAFYIKTGRVVGWNLHGRVANNATDLRQAGIRPRTPVGECVHIEDVEFDSSITAHSGVWRDGGGGDCLATHHGETGDQLKLTVTGADYRGDGSIKGRVVVAIANARQFGVDLSDALGGYALAPSPNPGYVYSVATDSRRYFGVSDGPPGPPGDGQALYFDSGERSDSRAPSWRFNDGSGWHNV